MHIVETIRIYSIVLIIEKFARYSYRYLIKTDNLLNKDNKD